MRFIKKLVLVALAATALFAALATTALARRFEITETRIRVTFRELIFEGGGDRVECEVIIEGTFHYRTITKVERSLIGYITRAAVNEAGCRSQPVGIRARILAETLPWHVRYSEFEGVLPEVRIQIQFINAGFDLNNVPLLGVCKYRSASPFMIIGGPNTGPITEGNATMIAEERVRIRSETAFCPELILASGPEPILILGTVNAVRVRLI